MGRTEKLRRCFRSLVTGALVGVALWATGCSSTRKSTVPQLSELAGKRIALVEIIGETSARKVIEVALVNQLVQRGTFFLIPKSEIEVAKRALETTPDDPLTLAKQVNADVALTIRVLDWQAEVRDGYDQVQIQDSQLAKERGDDGKDHRMVKRQRLDALVRFNLEFRDLKPSSPEAVTTRSAVAEAMDQAEATNEKGAIRLPLKLRFLEQLTNRAFHHFFEKYAN